MWIGLYNEWIFERNNTYGIQIQQRNNSHAHMTSWNILKLFIQNNDLLSYNYLQCRHALAVHTPHTHTPTVSEMQSFILWAEASVTNQEISTN